MDFQDDAAEFSREDVDTIVKNAIAGCLTDVMYNPKKVEKRYTIFISIHLHTNMICAIDEKQFGTA